MEVFQVAIETEQVGTVIIEDLGTQRESLERTRNRLVNTGMIRLKFISSFRVFLNFFLCLKIASYCYTVLLKRYYF